VFLEEAEDGEVHARASPFKSSAPVRVRMIQAGAGAGDGCCKGKAAAAATAGHGVDGCMRVVCGVRARPGRGVGEGSGADKSDDSRADGPVSDVSRVVGPVSDVSKADGPGANVEAAAERVRAGAPGWTGASARGVSGVDRGGWACRWAGGKWVCDFIRWVGQGRRRRWLCA